MKRKRFYFRCIHCGGLFVGDKRRKSCDNVVCKGKELDRKRALSRDAYYKRKETDNPCVLCGKDKGRNYYYCKDCLKDITPYRSKQFEGF